MAPRKTTSLFLAGFVSGLVALAFNFLLRLGGLAAYPPESALAVFLRIVPASIEEPAVQGLGELAGQLGLGVATLIAAGVYGLLTILFDRFLSGRLAGRRLGSFEGLLTLGFVSWVLFGLVVLPLSGDSFFGSGSAFASPSAFWAYPLTLLLVQGVFALVLSPRYQWLPAIAGTKGADASRRGFLEKSAVGLLAAIAGIMSIGGLGSLFSAPIQVTGGSQPIDLQDAPAIFSDPRLSTLVESEQTPNDSFYRVAIDIIDPAVDLSGWSLTVSGLVGSPKTYTLQEIQALPQAVQYTTLECVSNQINGDLISNAKWTGVRISDLLQDAGGPWSGAKYIVFYSVDGYSVGIPLSKALMPDSLLAYSMNGQPLPVRHGYPLRGLIPGLYGMMSAKWVKQISLLDSEYHGYWQTRGWTNGASINTVSFIVIPGPGGQVSLSKNGGSVVLAGYAFAGDRGISKVELSFDQGKTWQLAQLKKALSNLTWALWAYEWTPSATGGLIVYARATDASGQTQTSAVTGTFPNGATGYAAIGINVVD
ncbi:MAG: molybdopterin-dependent oxidoreductase [Nitrososphaerales archaeon]|nr:molybdopterin-dependent oxidoreductase [Nitrososphaerales archaeon]